MREYETTFIVQPEISDEGSQAILSKLDGVLEAGSSTRLMCEDHGKRKLAYEIRKFHKGHYYTLQFLDDGAVVPDVERVLRLEESVLRFLTILVTDEVEDIEVAGVVFFERETGRWMVEFDHKEIRDVPRTQTAWEQAFPCFQCRNDLTEQIQRDGLSLGDVCSNCGFAIHHPIMPPGAR